MITASVMRRAARAAATGLIAATAVPLVSAPSAASTPAPVGRIVVSTDSGGRVDTSEIWTMNVDGTDPVRLTDNVAYDGEPVWSQDGSRIAFTSAVPATRMRLAIVIWIEKTYHRRHRQDTLGHMTPIEYETPPSARVCPQDTDRP